MCVRLWDLITHNQLIVSEWVKRFADKIPKDHQDQRVLDYACGSGRHTLFLQEKGHKVLGIDRDALTLQNLQNSFSECQLNKVELRCEDLEQEHFSESLSKEKFAGLVVTNYLYRPHLEKLLDLVKVGGIVIYETFAIGNEKFGKPSNPHFLLKENELLEVAMKQNKFKVIAFESLEVGLPKQAKIQRICAERI